MNCFYILPKTFTIHSVSHENYGCRQFQGALRRSTYTRYSTVGSVFMKPMEQTRDLSSSSVPEVNV